MENLQFGPSFINIAINITKDTFVPITQIMRESIQPPFNPIETTRKVFASLNRLNMVFAVRMTSPGPFKSKSPRQEFKQGKRTQNNTTVIRTLHNHIFINEFGLDRDPSLIANNTI